LFDDLTAGLEPPAVAALGAILAAVRARGVTIVAAARTLDGIPASADHVVAIDRGKTAEMGVHATVNV
jgi:ABC-type polar amino acid transport system ATPase subunit